MGLPAQCCRSPRLSSPRRSLTDPLGYIQCRYKHVKRLSLRSGQWRYATWGMSDQGYICSSDHELRASLAGRRHGYSHRASPRVACSCRSLRQCALEPYFIALFASHMSSRPDLDPKLNTHSGTAASSFTFSRKAYSFNVPTRRSLTFANSSLPAVFKPCRQLRLVQ